MKDSWDVEKRVEAVCARLKPEPQAGLFVCEVYGDIGAGFAWGGERESERERERGGERDVGNKRLSCQM